MPLINYGPIRKEGVLLSHPLVATLSVCQPRFATHPCLSNLINREWPMNHPTKFQPPPPQRWWSIARAASGGLLCTVVDELAARCLIHRSGFMGDEHIGIDGFVFFFLSFSSRFALTNYDRRYKKWSKYNR